MCVYIYGQAFKNIVGKQIYLNRQRSYRFTTEL